MTKRPLNTDGFIVFSLEVLLSIRCTWISEKDIYIYIYTHIPFFGGFIIFWFPGQLSHFIALEKYKYNYTPRQSLNN